MSKNKIWEIAKKVIRGIAGEVIITQDGIYMKDLFGSTEISTRGIIDKDIFGTTIISSSRDDSDEPLN